MSYNIIIIGGVYMKKITELRDKWILTIKRLNVSQIIIFGFLAIIILGTLILWLPFSSKSGYSNGLLTALFTATSATCVTGLALGDTYTQWSLFGQVVILTMIELGGLGFMSVGSLFLFALRRNVNLRSMLIMAQSVGTDNMEDVVRIQKKIISGGLLVELIGALVLAARFTKWYSLPKALWLGVFHSVSAFCNAGFDILGFIEPGASLFHFKSDAIIIITLSFLIVIGGIGFVVWDDLTRERNPKKWSVYTKIVLISTAILLITGTAAFLFLEFRNVRTIGRMPLSDKILNAFFQSVTTRTAGFAAIDQGGLTETGKILTILFMFIGGVSGSTAGGLKVVTFVIILLFLLSRMRGKEEVIVYSRRITETQIMNALCLFGMMILLSFIGTFIICGTTEFRFVEGMYETVSALATVGLSTGVLNGIGLASKLLLIVYMYFGRVGILTISMGFLQKGTKADTFQYADINLPIG